MSKKQTMWVHPSSLTFRLDEPTKVLETIWSERPGWGFIKRRDLWQRKECSIDDLLRAGYVLRRPVSEDGALTCPYCGMYIVGIPGNLVRKHFAECGGGGEDWMKLEAAVMDDVRIKQHQARLMAEKLRMERELAEAEKKERFDRIRDEQLVRQKDKDRKARLRRTTKEELMRR